MNNTSKIKDDCNREMSRTKERHGSDFINGYTKPMLARFETSDSEMFDCGKEKGEDFRYRISLPKNLSFDLPDFNGDFKEQHETCRKQRVSLPTSIPMNEFSDYYINENEFWETPFLPQSPPLFSNEMLPHGWDAVSDSCTHLPNTGVSAPFISHSSTQSQTEIDLATGGGTKEGGIPNTVHKGRSQSFPDAKGFSQQVEERPCKVHRWVPSITSSIVPNTDDLTSGSNNEVTTTTTSISSKSKRFKSYNHNDQERTGRHLGKKNLASGVSDSTSTGNNDTTASTSNSSKNKRFRSSKYNNVEKKAMILADIFLRIKSIVDPSTQFTDELLDSFYKFREELDSKTNYGKRNLSAIKRHIKELRRDRNPYSYIDGTTEFEKSLLNLLNCYPSQLVSI